MISVALTTLAFISGCICLVAHWDRQKEREYKEKTKIKPYDDQDYDDYNFGF